MIPEAESLFSSEYALNIIITSLKVQHEKE